MIVLTLQIKALFFKGEENKSIPPRISILFVSLLSFFLNFLLSLLLSLPHLTLFHAAVYTHGWVPQLLSLDLIKSNPVADFEEAALHVKHFHARTHQQVYGSLHADRLVIYKWHRCWYLQEDMNALENPPSTDSGRCSSFLEFHIQEQKVLLTLSIR